jgi:hypothetical protein
MEKILKIASILSLCIFFACNEARKIENKDKTKDIERSQKDKAKNAEGQVFKDYNPNARYTKKWKVMVHYHPEAQNGKKPEKEEFLDLKADSAYQSNLYGLIDKGKWVIIKPQGDYYQTVMGEVPLTKDQQVLELHPTNGNIKKAYAITVKNGKMRAIATFDNTVFEAQ